MDEHFNDGLCGYREYDKRCPLPGSMNHATKEGGKWFCAGHFFNDSGIDASEVLYFNVKNYDLIMHSRKCRKIICNKCDEYKKIKKTINCWF